MDTTDGTEGTQHSGESQTPEKADQGTSKQTPEPGMSKDDVTKLLRDQAATHGRDMKVVRDEVAGLKSQAEQDKAALTAKEAELSDAEDKMAGDNTDAVDVVRLKREVRVARTALESDRAQLEKSKKEQADTVTQASRSLRDLEVLKIAAAKKVDLDTLIGIVGDSEDMNWVGRVADTLSETVTVEQTTHVDSGLGSGSPGEKSDEQRSKERYPSMYKT